MNLFWFRRDLRLEDNAGLYHALKNGKPVLPVFIFDTDILDKLEDKHDARVTFIYDALKALKAQLNELGSDLHVFFGEPEEVWKELLNEFEFNAVFTNRDYEPYGIQRDKAVKKQLGTAGVEFYDFKDQVIFEKSEITKEDGSPYLVFTPYSRKWKAKLLTKHAIGQNRSSLVKKNESFFLQSYPSQKYFENFMKTEPSKLMSLESLGFVRSILNFPDKVVAQKLIKEYEGNRNYPAIEGTSRLGVHFRFGTISIREKARHSIDLSEVFLNELIWRDFYAMILANFPNVVNSSFRKKYEPILWLNDPKDFQCWCEGRTGYPLVDAGMRELNETGFMHNRVRMVAASFLTKHLLIDWRLGEAYFAAKLLDFDLASNNGGWQWAAGCGTDAAPYFRIFNPTTQMQKFDKDGEYVRKWVGEINSNAYPEPIVEHAFARERCLRAYKEALET